MSRSMPKKILSILLCFSLCIGMVIVLDGGTEVRATTVQDLQDKIDQLQQEKEEIDRNLAATEDDLAAAEAEQDTIESQITNIESQIAVYQERINLLNMQIAEKEMEIAQKEEEIAQKEIEIAQNEELFKKRVRAMYMSDDATVLSVLFGAETFAEFLTAAESAKYVAEYDRNLINTLLQQKQEVEDSKVEIETLLAEIVANRETVEADKAEVDLQRAELSAAYKKSTESVNDLRAIAARYNKTAEEIEVEMEAASQEMAELIRREQSTGEVSEGGWMWPLPGYRSISSGYGYRTFDNSFHKGIDIPAPQGTPIVASKSGRVIRADWSNSYGWVVVIDHGGQMSTLYAHASSLAVSYGQQVEQGDVVSYVGNTGNSFGNHLHFEVRVNGEHVPPLNYVSA